MPSITQKLFPFLNRNKAVYLKYIMPVILVMIATIVKFYALADSGYKAPYVLYSVVIIICGIYSGIRSAVIALLVAVAFSLSIYFTPGIYASIPSNSYSVLVVAVLSVILLALVATSHFKITNINKEKEAQFKFLAEAVTEKIWTADNKTGKANYYNQVWYEYTGCKNFEELHSQVWSLIHPDDREKGAAKYKKHLAEGTGYELELRLRKRDGSYRWHLTRTNPKIDSQGNITLWIGICVDIHDQKLMADAVKESERQSSALVKKMDEFISIASHELKTPVTSIQGYLQIMERMVHENKDTTYIDFISKAKRQLSKFSALVQDLLDVSKIQEGKLQFSFTEFKVSDLLQEAIESTLNNYPTHRIDVKGDTNITITADRFRLEQVLCNLLSNAVKYSPNADKVIVEVSSKDDSLQISVTDFGIGISEKNEQYIFDRFYRVEDVSYKFSGLGVGLYICSEIIKRHKGSIWFTTIPGKGSMFSFSVPIHGVNSRV